MSRQLTAAMVGSSGTVEMLTNSARTTIFDGGFPRI
jgi:hypothetical protein